MFLLDEPQKTPDSVCNQKLKDLNKKVRELQRELERIPPHMVEAMDAESLSLERDLENFAPELENSLELLKILAEHCLTKWRFKPSQDRRWIKQLVIWLVEAYAKSFKRIPTINKTIPTLFLVTLLM
jgi:hypothetical protein